MIRNPKQFRALILNHVDAGQSWGVIATEFKCGYNQFVQWLENEPLHEDHLEKLHAIEMKWREELEKTDKNKRRIAGL